MRTTTLLASAALCALAMAAQPALADDGAAPATSTGASKDASKDGGVAEIIVTANKREQKLNTVGLTIQAAAGSELVQRGISSPSDLSKLVPGFTFTQSLFSTPVYTLRGVGLYDPTFGAAPAVAVYSDQIPRNAPVMSDALDLDVERLEVLKGPQGTMFGQSSTGGAINYIFGKPTRELHFGADASYERFGLVSVSGFISGPLSDSVQVRLAAKGQSGGAWQYSLSRPNDEIGNTRKIEGRLTVDIEPASNVKIELSATGARDRSDPQAPQYTGSLYNVFPSAAAAAAAGDPYAVINPTYYAALTDPTSPGYNASFLSSQATLLSRMQGTFTGGISPAATWVAGATALLGTPIVNKARAADWYRGLLGPSNSPYYQFTARLDWNITPTITLTSVTALARKGEHYAQSLTGTAALDIDPAPIFGNVRTFNQEIHLAGNSERLHWIFGGNYDNVRTSQSNVYNLSDYSANAGGLIHETLNEFTSSALSYAVFANAEYKLTDHLTVQGGVRYTDNRQKATYCYSDPADDTAQGTSFVFGQFLNATPITILPGQCFPVAPNGYSTLTPVHESQNKGNVSFRVGVNYKFDQGTLLYATISQGYKAGVFSAIGASKADQYTPAVQEKLTAYEAGFKAPLLGRKVQFNGSVFYYDYVDKQVEGWVMDTVFGLLEKMLNVPKSYVFGLEGELTAQPVEGLRISGGATYLHAKVTSDFIKTADGKPIYNLEGYTGNFRTSNLPYTPSFSANLDAQYEVPVANGLKAYLGGTLVYVGKQNGTYGTAVLRAEQFEIPSYATLDLRAGVGAQDGRWRAEVYGRNITNKVYTTSVSEYHDTSLRYLGKPTTYGVALSFKY